jgi:formylglycine-generating enzyme required for sulfatase activity
MPLPQTGSLASGTVIADCRIERLLGVGGMGEVYLATHLRLDIPIALKILPSRSVGDKDAVDRFVREAKLAAKIKHPNVVKILDVDRRGNDHFILMDYVEGANLSEVLKRHDGPLPYRQALRLVQLAAKGTAAVHEFGLIHRDIKPANIMLTTKKNVILMDFGLVRKEGDSEVTSTGAVLGTPAFMSPEQARGEPLDARSDVFSLGSTLYYLLTAKLPFEGSQIDVLIQLQQGKAPRAVNELNPYVPKPVAEFVRRVMAPRREDRPRSAAALAAEIKPFLDAPKGASTIEQTDTAGGSGLKTGPYQADDLVPLESVRDEVTLLQKAKPYLPWFTLLAVALSVLVIVLALQNRKKDEAKNDPAPAPTKKDDPKPKVVDRTNMISIAGGSVQIGNNEDELRAHALTLDLLKSNEMLLESFVEKATKPARKAKVETFWIDKYEVTNAEYAKFVQATKRVPPEHWSGNTPPKALEQHPVTMVTHADALAYAAWAGKQLPTEEQWVRAFRAEKGIMYPWGDQWSNSRSNVKENTKLKAGTSPVTGTPDDVSAFGVYNLNGNVCELLRDKRMREGELVVVTCGAHYEADGRVYGQASMPFHWANDFERNANTGFRCVEEVPK